MRRPCKPPAAVDDTTDGGVWVCQHTPPPAAQRHTAGRGRRRRLGAVPASRRGGSAARPTAHRGGVYRQGEKGVGRRRAALHRRRTPICAAGDGATGVRSSAMVARGQPPVPGLPQSGGRGSGSRRPRQGGACGQGGGSGGRACDTPAPPSSTPWEGGEAEMMEKTAAARATRERLPMGRYRGCVPSGMLFAATASASDPDRLGGSVRSTSSSFALPEIELTL